MNRITGIEITNLLAFQGKHKFSPEGKSLLIYGENGSGKSSLFRALELFFDAGHHPDAMSTYRNRWALPADDPAGIELAFEGRANAVNFTQVAAENWISDIYLSSGYLSYREMLRTHFDLAEDPNYFDLVVNHILKGYKTTTGDVLSRDWNKIEDACAEFLLMVQPGGDWHNPDAIVPTGDAIQQGDEETDEGEMTTVADLRANRLQEIDSLIDEFNKTLMSFLDLLNSKTEGFLKAFDNKATITLALRQARDRNGSDIFTGDSNQPFKGAKFDFRAEDIEVTQSLIRPFVTTEVSLFNQSFPEYQSFLNEARLSALALCIFLGAIHAKPSQNETKILFLDDVLIGLDTGNRRPLLNLLKEYFDDYQVFLTTYDKGWFEIARIHLNYKAVEMYYEPVKQVRQPDGAFQELPSGDEFPDSVADSDKRYFERPLIKDTEDYLKLAQIYFIKKDYPASANYQRKWCEQFIKGYLQENYRLELSKNEGTLALTKLDTLFGKLEKFYKDCGIPLPRIIEEEFALHRDTVMNPFSHDDLQSQVYRQELESGFKLIEAFQALKPLRKAVIAYKGDIIQFAEPSANYSCRFKITTEPLTLVIHGKDAFIKGKGDVVDYTENGTTHPAPAQRMSDLTIMEFHEKIIHHLTTRNENFKPNPDLFAALILHPQQISLREIIDG